MVLKTVRYLAASVRRRPLRGDNEQWKARMSAKMRKPRVNSSLLQNLILDASMAFVFCRLKNSPQLLHL